MHIYHTDIHTKLGRPIKFSGSCVNHFDPVLSDKSVLWIIWPHCSATQILWPYHISYASKRLNEGPSPRILALTVKAAQNRHTHHAHCLSRSRLSLHHTHTHTHTHTHREMHNLSEGEASCSADWRVSFPPPGNESETAPPVWTNGVGALLQLTANQNHFLSAHSRTPTDSEWGWWVLISEAVGTLTSSFTCYFE